MVLCRRKNCVKISLEGGDMVKELTQLQYFRTVARLENISRAAEYLHISQPNLSRAIKRLEDDLGVRLFDRNRGRIYLNKYGKAYLDYVEKAFETLDAGEQKLKTMVSRDLDKHVSVACTMQLYMEDMIKDYVRDNPDIGLNISYSKMDIAAINNALWNGSLDMALTPSGDYSPGIQWEPILSCVICGLVPKSSPLETSKRIEMYELHDLPFVCNNSGIDRQLTEEFCSKAGFIPNIVFESNESSFAGSWIENEMGITLISAYDLMGLVRASVSQSQGGPPFPEGSEQMPVKAIRFSDPEPILTLGIARKMDTSDDSEKPKQAARKYFMDYAAKHFMQLNNELNDSWEGFWDDYCSGRY